MVQSIVSLRQRYTELEHATCILSIECNLGLESVHLTRAIARREGARPYRVMNEGPGGSAGFLTTNATKSQGYQQVRECLRVGKIAFGKKFFSNTLDDKAVAELQKELNAFSVIKEPPRTLGGKMRVFYSGKKAGGKDDLVMALLIAMVSLRRFYSDPRYSTLSVPVELPDGFDSMTDEQRAVYAETNRPLYRN